MAVDTVDITGADDAAAKLRAIVPALRARVLRNALAEGGRIVRDEARDKVPELKKPTPYRASGTVKKAIVVRNSKLARRAGDMGVFINVRPAKGAVYRYEKTLFGRVRYLKRASQRGAQSPTDPFYWRWLEFGRKGMAKRPFLQPAAARLSDAQRVITTSIYKWIGKVEAAGKVQA